MTWFTKVSIAPAKPLSSGATKLTLELNKVFSMFGTIFDGDLAAIRANKFLGIIGSLVLSFIHSIGTIFSSPKVRLFAFIALEIGIDGHGILIRFPEIRRVLISEFLIFHTFFEF